MRRLKAYVTAFLFQQGQVLLLKRSDRKTFAPGQWTGVGGGVLLDEFDDLQQAVLREIFEETGIRDVLELTLRAVDTKIEGIDVAVIFFYSAELPPSAADCFACMEAGTTTSEGSLHWVDPADVESLPLIPNARQALNLVLTGDSSKVTFL